MDKLHDMLPLERIEEAITERIIYALRYGDIVTVERLVDVMRRLSLV